MLANGERITTLNVERSFLKENKRYKTLNVGPYGQAQYLVEKFEKLGCNDAAGCYKYFVKCFRTLPENVIWDIYETASHNPKVKFPIKYFIGACRNQMK